MSLKTMVALAVLLGSTGPMLAVEVKSEETTHLAPVVKKLKFDIPIWHPDALWSDKAEAVSGSGWMTGDGRRTRLSLRNWGAEKVCTVPSLPAWCAGQVIAGP